MHRIPTVSPPTVITVNEKGCIVMVNGNNGFLAGVACAPNEIPFVSPCEMSLDAALRTHCRRRDRLFLAIEDGRNFFVKSEIIIGNFKRLLTVAAGLLHGGRITEYQNNRITGVF